AEVKLVRPDKNQKSRLAIVSDGPTPWMLRYFSAFGANGPYIQGKLIRVDADRMLFVHGIVLHLIDTKNGVVLRRWVLSERIEGVRVDGEKFHVMTVADSGAAPIHET